MTRSLMRSLELLTPDISKLDIAGNNNKEIAASRELHPDTFRMLSTS
jgi:hypothetical protein